MSNKLKVAALFLCLFTTQTSFAFLEIRGTYGQLSGGPDLKDLYSGTVTNLPTVSPSTSYGGDAIITLPFLPGIGIRYEKLRMKTSNENLEAIADYTRTAVLVNARIIDTILFLGPIASYGTSHSGTLTIKDTKEREWSSDTVSSFQVGIEAGIKLVGIVIGVEAGHQGYKWKDAKEKNDLETKRKDIDMSGTYVKGLLGISF